MSLLPERAFRKRREFTPEELEERKLKVSCLSGQMTKPNLNSSTFFFANSTFYDLKNTECNFPISGSELLFRTSIREFFC